MTAEHAKQRVVFGRTIYHAIKHSLADMLGQVECVIEMVEKKAAC